MACPVPHPSPEPKTLLEQAQNCGPDSIPEAMALTNQALELALADESGEQVDKILAHRAQLFTHLKDTDAAMADAKRALAGYTRRGDQRARASILNTMAIIREHLGEYTESFELQRECLAIFRDLQIPQAIATVASNIGLTCTYVGDWNQALKFYKESLQVWETLPNEHNKGLLLINLGFAYASIKDFEQADKFYQEALVLYGENNAPYSTLVFGNRANIQLQQGNLSKARELAERSMELSLNQQDPAKRAHALECMGSVLAAAGEVREARSSFQKALEIYNAIPIPRGGAIVLKQLARLPDTDPAKSTEYLNQARRLAEESGLKPILIEVLGDFHENARSQGNWEAACRYLEEKTTAEKALLKDFTSIKLKSMQMDIKLKQSQRETEAERRLVIQLSDAMNNLHAQKQLAEEQSRQKSEILNFAAHDLRNLLWGILGPADLIESDRDQFAHIPNMLDLVSAMKRSAQALEETLQNVLNAAATESGSITLKLAACDVTAMIRDLVLSWQQVATQKAQTLYFSSGQQPIVATIDAPRIRDCLNNLVSNAIKYSPKKSLIRIEARQTGDELVLEVADEGPGLTADDRQLAGKLFQRLSAQPTGNEISTGVGLAVVKRFSELHGGRMEIECPPTGGSVFRIILPGIPCEQS